MTGHERPSNNNSINEKVFIFSFTSASVACGRKITKTPAHSESAIIDSNLLRGGNVARVQETVKQTLIVVSVLAVALVAWLFLWLRNEDAVATSAARPWPGGMGSLDAVGNRWPSLKANDASVKLPELAKAFSENAVVDDC